MCYVLWGVCWSCDPDISAGILFVAFGVVASTFTKNMIIILIIAMVATEMVRIGFRFSRKHRYEGMETNDSTVNTDDTNAKTDPNSSDPNSSDPNSSVPIIDEPSIDEQKLDMLQNRLDEIQTDIYSLKKTLIDQA
jgi:hypothetical protein